VASLATAVAIAFLLPETRATGSRPGGFAAMSASLLSSRAFIGYMLCQVLASQIIFSFAGRRSLSRGDADGPHQRRIWRVVCHHRLRLTDRQRVCVRFSPALAGKLIWFGLALQVTGSALNLGWSIFFGINQVPQWLFGTQMIVMVATPS